eukprot:g30439.t1
MVQPPKKKVLNWTPSEGHSPSLDMSARAARRCVNVRLISRAHKAVQNVTQAQRHAIHVLNTNRNIVIKPAEKAGDIVIQNRMDYCREVYQQLNNQEYYRHLPADPTKEHTHQLNRLIKTFDPVIQSILCIPTLRTSCVGDFYCLPKIHKANTPGHPIISANGTLCENLSGYIEGILKPIVKGTPSFRHEYDAQLIDRQFRHATVKNSNSSSEDRHGI